jgi:hypothetical protein
VHLQEVERIEASCNRDAFEAKAFFSYVQARTNSTGQQRIQRLSEVQRNRRHSEAESITDDNRSFAGLSIALVLPFF